MTRRASSFELILPPRPEGTPNFHWLRNALRTEILNGRIEPGSKLPASRELARQYQLSRGTILAGSRRAPGGGLPGSAPRLRHLRLEDSSRASAHRPAARRTGWRRSPAGPSSLRVRHPRPALPSPRQAGEQRLPYQSSRARSLSHDAVGAARVASRPRRHHPRPARLRSCWISTSSPGRRPVRATPHAASTALSSRS